MVAKIMGESVMRNRVFAWSRSITPQEIYTLKRENSNFTVEKPGRYYLNQEIKINITGGPAPWLSG